MGNIYSEIAQSIKEHLYDPSDDKRSVLNNVLNRKHLSWIGGSILSSSISTDDDEIWITRKKYEEIGPSIITRKWY